MNPGRLISVLRTLLLRGLGSGVSVLFTVLVSRYLETPDAALFFVLFNASVIAAVCFRWGVDEVVIRRVAAAPVDKRNAIAAGLVVQAHRRVLIWVIAAFLLGLVLLLPSVRHHFGGVGYLDFALMVTASALIACASAAARVLQGEGRTDAATFYLNICTPSLALIGLLCLVLLDNAVSARQLLWCYLLAAVVMYGAVVPMRFGRNVLLGLLRGGARVVADASDRAAANRLGAVVLAQQALGWSAVAIIPIYYGDSAYAGFVVSQKLATLISLLMLAINFTFSSRFAALHAQGKLQELWKLVRLSSWAILIASAAILTGAWLFMGPILDYARVSTYFGGIVIIMMIGQMAFSMAALYAVVLSMCHQEKFLLRIQSWMAVLSIVSLILACSLLSLDSAVWVLVAGYGALAVLLYAKVARTIGRNSEESGVPLEEGGRSALVFERVQKLKASPRCIFDGVNYGRVAAPYLYDFSSKAIIKRLLFSTLFSTRLLTQGGDGKRVLIYSCRSKNRTDYDYIVDRNRAAMGAGATYVEVVERLDLIQWTRSFAVLPSSLRMAVDWKGGILQKLLVALLFAKFRSSSRPVLDAAIRGARQVVTFCDAQPTENLASQIGRMHGAVTLTNQHGQYRYLEARNLSEDAEVYANFVSDYLLCWGEATISEFALAGVGREQMIVTGWLRKWPRLGLPQSASASEGTFGVMLNGENGRDSNAAMLAVAEGISKQTGMRYLVRLHPWSDAATYRGLCGSGCAGLEKLPLDAYQRRVSFSIAHMSGAIVELLCFDQAVYLLDDGKLADAFRIPGLALKSLTDILSAVAADGADPQAARERRRRLARWYNDDSDQDERLRKALLVE